jgi:TOBE domain
VSPDAITKKSRGMHLPGNGVTKHEAYTEIETPWFRGRARSEGYLPGDAAALSIRPEHVILHRRDRPLPESPDTVLDVEIDDEVPMGNSHRLYLRVLKDRAPTDCVIESDAPAHPYHVMGVGSRRDWGISLTR